MKKIINKINEFIEDTLSDEWYYCATEDYENLAEIYENHLWEIENAASVEEAEKLVKKYFRGIIC